MAASAVSSNLFNSESVQSQHQQIVQEFQQLGKDLQSGNLSAAQSDFATLQQDVSQTAAASSTQSANPIAQAFSQLGQDLKSGNLASAQQDYSNIIRDFQKAQTQHHHHAAGGQSNPLRQDFDQLGQALQSGNLSAAQQAYSSLQQGLQQLALSSATSTTQSAAQPSASVTVSLNA
jgi:hypothetical protein